MPSRYLITDRDQVRDTTIPNVFLAETKDGAWEWLNNHYDTPEQMTERATIEQLDHDGLYRDVTEDWANDWRSDLTWAAE